MSSKLEIKEKYIIDYIISTITMNSLKMKNIECAKYHHNSSYKHTLSILKDGILSLKKLQKKGIKHFTEEELKILSDTESHANGIDGISLSIPKLNDLYKGEEEYDPYQSQNIDYVISDRVKAMRFTKNYGNEYITYDDILLKDIKSLDFRLIKLIKENKKNNFYKDLIYKYNMLLFAAREIKKRNLDIQLREMSDHKVSLDIDGLSKLPILKMGK